MKKVIKAVENQIFVSSENSEKVEKKIDPKKMNYKDHCCEIVREAIPYELANFIYNYLLLKRDAVEYMYSNNVVQEENALGLFGTWKDQQIPNTYSHYGDMVMETLLMKLLPKMRELTGLNLIPCYAYTRLYKKGDVLARHLDRASCERSCTIHFGGEPWEISIDPTKQLFVTDTIQHPTHQEAVVKPNAPKGISLVMKPGDMLAYWGTHMEHWREPFEGTNHAQAFLHYNDADGPFANQNLYDKRPLLGVPSIGEYQSAIGERRPEEVRDFYKPTWDEELRNK